MPRYDTDQPRNPTVTEYDDFVYDCKFVNLAPNRMAPWYVLGNANPMYNCVAWTLGVKDVELGTEQDPFPLAGVNEFYAAFGYTSLNGAIPINNFQLYDVLAYGPSQNGVAHVAVYLNVDGVGPTWTSKMGQAQLITHLWNQLNPGSYGGYWPNYYTHNGTIPYFTGQTPEGETFEQTVQRLLRESGLDRL